MEAILIGLVVNIITKMSERLHISKTYVSIGLSLLLGAGYYIVKTYVVQEYPVQWEAAVAFATESYGISQIVYGLIRKYSETESVKKK